MSDTTTTDSKAKATGSKSRSPKPTDVVFKFTGDPEAGAGRFPGRDLTNADVDRLTTRRTIPEPGARGLHRGESGFSEARAKVVRELSASGKFKKRS